MAAVKRFLLWTLGALLLVVGTAALYIANRGGHYAVYPPASFASLALPDASTSPAPDPQVQVASGALRGMAVGPVVTFRGIPYARPPVGALRWQPPQAPLPWDGIRDARRPGSACTQPTEGLTPFFDPMARAYGARFEQAPVVSSEDCLFLDVWAPEWPAKHRLPVMVWLHGGSNAFGSGTQPMYEGVSLVRRGVVLVTINYRLGAMGFFAHPALTAESPQHSSGNYGLLDQLSALAWVKQNIGQFGGDPDNVTLFGESAGGVDSARLMASPLAAGLFKRVISESGPAFDEGQTMAEAEAVGSAVGSQAPGDPAQSELQRLRGLPAVEVNALVAKATPHRSARLGDAKVDGWVLPVSPRKAFLTGAIQPVDLLIGLNGREFSAFRLSAAAAAKKSGSSASDAQQAPGLKQFEESAHPYFGLWTDPAIALYFGRVLLHKDAGLDAAANDLLAAAPIGAIASLTSATGAHVFFYRFERAIPTHSATELGAFHGLEVPYVFGTLRTQEWRWLPVTADDERLSDLIQSYWSNFARSGDPNATGLPPWPAWSDARKEFLVVQPDASVTAQHTFPPLLSNLDAANLKQAFQAR